MLKTIEQIQEDILKASRKKRGMYYQCLDIIRNYNEVYVIAQHIDLKARIKIYLKRRKTSEDKKLYATELKILRRQLKWIEYCIIKQPKIKRNERNKEYHNQELQRGRI